MDRHFFISVSTFKSNKMGEEFQSYVEQKYQHVVVHKDDFYGIKADKNDININNKDYEDDERSHRERHQPSGGGR